MTAERWSQLLHERSHGDSPAALQLRPIMQSPRLEAKSKEREAKFGVGIEMAPRHGRYSNLVQGREGSLPEALD
jgi:hypothetical protein